MKAVQPFDLDAALRRQINRQLNTLPDSIGERKEVLADLMALTPTKWPERRMIANLLLSIHDHELFVERAQLQFSELLSGGNLSGDGQGGKQ